MGSFDLAKNSVGDMDELDLNAFSIKPDAIIFYTLVQIVGVLAKNVELNRPLIDGLMIKCMMVDDFEDLCEAQGYINPNAINPVTKEPTKDPYYEAVENEKKKLGLTDDNKVFDITFWTKSAILARTKMKLLEKRVFNSAAKYKELQY